MCLLAVFCFCRQNTEYELHVSDWISDVCSSDLHDAEPGSHTRVLASMDACGSYSKKSDKRQSDPSKISVKFHGCHGHHVGIPVASAPEIERIAPVRVVLLRNRAGLAPPTRSDTFRTPIA